MQNNTKNSKRKIAETRINTRFLAPMGGGVAQYKESKISAFCTLNGIFKLPAQHNKYRLNKIQTKLREKNSFLYALLFNDFSQIKKEKLYKIKDIQNLLSPSFLLCQFGGNNG